MTVAAAIEPKELRVEPGTTVSARIRIRNDGSRVDGYRLTVVGDPARWSRIDPPEIQLFPNSEGEATLTLAPPRDPLVRAGRYVFGMHAASTTQADSMTTEEGHVTVEPFQAIAIEIAPRVSHGWRRGSHRLTVRNLGNALARATVQARDLEERVRLAVDPPETDIEPGTSETVDIEVTPSRWLVRGADRRWPFEVEAGVPPLARDRLTATFEQRALVPTWAAAAVGLVLAIIIAPFVIAWVTGNGAGQSPGTSPSAVATSTASDSASPTPGSPSATPSASPSPTPSASPPPTPRISSLTIGGVDPRASSDPYPISTTRSYYQGSALYVELRLFIRSEECAVTLVLPEDVAVARYNVDDFPIAGGFGCQGPTAPFAADDGVITVTDLSSGRISGTFFLTNRFGYEYAGNFEAVQLPG